MKRNVSLLLCRIVWMTADRKAGTLCCADADEAKTLIPSLTDKISDEDLTELLEEMQKFR